VAIDQDRGAEIPVHPREQPAQRPVVRLVKSFDAPDRVVDRDALTVDFLGVADDAGHRPQSSRHAHRTGIGERGEPAFEHARVEFVRLAVDVDIAAGKVRAHQRVSAPHDAQAELVDEAVLGAAQRRDLESRGGQERARIDAPTVR
jgi:hypothetical protein